MDNQLFDDFNEFERTLRRYMAYKRREQGPLADPHRGQGRILALLKIQPEITQKELTYLLDMRPQSLGELLTKLEKSGLITRQPSETDRRVMVVSLTEDGRVMAEATKASENSIFDQLTEAEQQQLQGILAKLTAAMVADLPEDEQLFGGDFDPEMRRKMMKAFKKGEFPEGFGFGGHGGHRNGFFGGADGRGRREGRQSEDFEGPFGFWK